MFVYIKNLFLIYSYIRIVFILFFILYLYYIYIFFIVFVLYYYIVSSNTAFSVVKRGLTFVFCEAWFDSLSPSLRHFMVAFCWPEFCGLLVSLRPALWLRLDVELNLWDKRCEVLVLICPRKESRTLRNHGCLSFDDAKKSDESLDWF